MNNKSVSSNDDEVDNIVAINDDDEGIPVGILNLQNYTDNEPTTSNEVIIHY